jgi:hypothetical protein
MAQSIEAPYNVARVVVPSDTANFPTNVGEGFCDAIYAGGAGVVAAIMEDGGVRNFTVVAGETLPIKAKRVNSTNTTATLMQALYRV